MYKSLSRESAVQIQPPAAIFRIGVPCRKGTGCGDSAGASVLGCRPSKFGCSAEPQLSTFPSLASAINEVSVDPKELMTGIIVVAVKESEWIQALKLFIEENMYRSFAKIVDKALPVRNVSGRIANNRSSG